MELIVLARFGRLPDDPADLLQAFLEAEWQEKRQAELTAAKLADVLSKLWRGR